MPVATEYKINQDVVQGWASKLFLPPTILNQFVPFVSMWASTHDAYGDRVDILGQGVNLDMSKYHDASVSGSKLALGTLKCKIVNSEVANINIFETTLIPLFSNVSQLITRDFRGGSGIRDFNVHYYGNEILLSRADANIEINNPFDLADFESSINRILVPGTMYLFVAGWQMNSNFDYSNSGAGLKDFDGTSSVDLVLPPQFDEVPGEFFVKDDQNPDGPPVMYIDLTDTHYGYLQSFFLTLYSVTLSIESGTNKVIAACSFISPSQWATTNITALQLQDDVTNKLKSLNNGKAYIGVEVMSVTSMTRAVSSASPSTTRNQPHGTTVPPTGGTPDPVTENTYNAQLDVLEAQIDAAEQQGTLTQAQVGSLNTDLNTLETPVDPNTYPNVTLRIGELRKRIAALQVIADNQELQRQQDLLKNLSGAPNFSDLKLNIG